MRYRMLAYCYSVGIISVLAIALVGAALPKPRFIAPVGIQAVNGSRLDMNCSTGQCLFDGQVPPINTSHLDWASQLVTLRYSESNFDIHTAHVLLTFQFPGPVAVLSIAIDLFICPEWNIDAPFIELHAANNQEFSYSYNDFIMTYQAPTYTCDCLSRIVIPVNFGEPAYPYWHILIGKFDFENSWVHIGEVTFSDAPASETMVTTYNDCSFQTSPIVPDISPSSNVFLAESVYPTTTLSSATTISSTFNFSPPNSTMIFPLYETTTSISSTSATLASPTNSLPHLVTSPLQSHVRTPVSSFVTSQVDTRSSMAAPMTLFILGYTDVHSITDTLVYKSVSATLRSRNLTPTLLPASFMPSVTQFSVGVSSDLATSTDFRDGTVFKPMSTPSYESMAFNTPLAITTELVILTSSRLSAKTSDRQKLPSFTASFHSTNTNPTGTLSHQHSVMASFPSLVEQTSTSSSRTSLLQGSPMSSLFTTTMPLKGSHIVSTTSLIKGIHTSHVYLNPSSSSDLVFSSTVAIDVELSSAAAIDLVLSSTVAADQVLSSTVASSTVARNYVSSSAFNQVSASSNYNIDVSSTTETIPSRLISTAGPPNSQSIKTSVTTSLFPKPTMESSHFLDSDSISTETSSRNTLQSQSSKLTVTPTLSTVNSGYMSTQEAVLPTTTPYVNPDIQPIVPDVDMEVFNAGPGAGLASDQDKRDGVPMFVLIVILLLVGLISLMLAAFLLLGIYFKRRESTRMNITRAKSRSRYELSVFNPLYVCPSILTEGVFQDSIKASDFTDEHGLSIKSTHPSTWVQLRPLLLADNILPGASEMQLNLTNDDLIECTSLASGSYGDIVLAHTNNVCLRNRRLCRADDNGESTKMLVAVKKLSTQASQVQREAFEKEVRFLSQIRHPNILSLLGVSYEDPAFAVMEYTEEGDLDQYLQKYSEIVTTTSATSTTQISISTLLYMASQISEAMQFLTALDFIHRDISTRKCIVGKNFLVKLADLGINTDAHRLYYYCIRGNQALPIRWLALECFDGKFSEKSDVWAFGVTMWELFTLTKDLPYPHLSDEEVVHCALQIENFQPLVKPESCPQSVYQIMQQCWAINLQQRATFQEVNEMFKTCL